MPAASEFYLVEGVDRPLSPLRRGLRIAGTVIGGLLGDTDTSSASDVVIRLSSDGSELNRISPGTFSEFQKTLALASADLARLDAVDFADAWIDPPA